MELKSNKEITGNEMFGFVDKEVSILNDKEIPSEQQEFSNQVKKANVKCSKQM